MHIIPGDTSGCIKLFLLVIYLLSKLHMCIYRLAYEEVMAKGSNRSARVKQELAANEVSGGVWLGVVQCPLSPFYLFFSLSSLSPFTQSSRARIHRLIIVAQALTSMLIKTVLRDNIYLHTILTTQNHCCMCTENTVNVTCNY